MPNKIREKFIFDKKKKSILRFFLYSLWPSIKFQWRITQNRQYGMHPTWTTMSINNFEGETIVNAIATNRITKDKNPTNDFQYTRNIQSITSFIFPSIWLLLLFFPIFFSFFLFFSSSSQMLFLAKPAAIQSLLFCQKKKFGVGWNGGG